MLQISHISKTFNPGTVNEKKALNGIDLHLDAGDFVTILGSNGAGKSTLFGAIAGSFVVDEGTIRLDGQNITSLPDYKRSKFIGRLFQDPLKGTAPSMTIEENLALAYLRASENGRPSPWSRRRTAPDSGKSWRSWSWGWKTGWIIPWVCCPAASVRR